MRWSDNWGCSSSDLLEGEAFMGVLSLPGLDGLPPAVQSLSDLCILWEADIGCYVWSAQGDKDVVDEVWKVGEVLLAVWSGLLGSVLDAFEGVFDLLEEGVRYGLVFKHPGKVFEVVMLTFPGHPPKRSELTLKCDVEKVGWLCMDKHRGCHHTTAATHILKVCPDQLPLALITSHACRDWH